MISKCIIKSEDGVSEYQGIYVNGSVLFSVINGRGHNVKHSAQWDAARMTRIEDRDFDYKMLAYRLFYDHCKKHRIVRFAKSRLWTEDICVRLIFKSRPAYDTSIAHMKELLILTVDGRFLALGEHP